ncbi:BCCT family transporter [Virgibacillus halodenitrificans]|uniref:BCCT family transporter n=1 Tax=Virgibacillus halodenitrificans TaxID=1482 RepID=A0AAC9IX45_VIRHA|nr:BCCT family transporter [Virgibacillus halodenitrificans]APC46953.1 BCCT transporter [Virgibacillus halodenitrificans]MBD1222995.1 BCCT family transporter [Virgibacillus halodenitrificans]MCG1027452.1 BCCT family transporter [Virgibacillus halodenitrificans]MCJ0930254.1 BCCT family transporter [Virgibacillus halodenitrificans]MEC2159516.1 BCCT family transporter [Virgibacillus halodenitrificans]
MDFFKRNKLDWPVFIFSGGFLILFILLSLLNSEMVDSAIGTLFGYAAEIFGGYWQLLLLGNFLIGLYLAFSKYGKVRLGKQSKPKYSYFRWIAMILVTLLASGGVFWAASEPMYHYMSTPPLFGGGEFNNIAAAFGQSFLHWGFLAWAILGTLATIVMMYVHYNKGLPLRPRGLLYPIFGEKIYKNSALGTTADVFSVISTVAGTLGPLGFLGLQISYGLNSLFNVPNTLTVSIIIVLSLAGIAAISAATGVDRGILTLSRYNVGLTIVLAVLVLIIGPTMFIIDSFIGGTGFQLQNFLTMSLYRGDHAWLGSWTIFFWGWFIGYAPMLIVFITRISRGRTIRDLIIAVSIVAPIVNNFWFSVVGGTGVFFEKEHPGSISTALNEGGMPAAVLAITDQLPLGMWIGLGFLLVSVIFVATTVDTMSYTVAATLTGNDSPKRWLRVFWALIFGATTVMILSIGEDSIASIQNSIVITAVPVSLLLLSPLWSAPKIARKMALDQGLIWEREMRKKVDKVEK